MLINERFTIGNFEFKLHGDPVAEDEDAPQQWSLKLGKYEIDVRACLPDFIERYGEAMEPATFAEQSVLVIKLYKDAAAAFAAMPDRDKHLITEKHWMWDL